MFKKKPFDQNTSYLKDQNQYDLLAGKHLKKIHKFIAEQNMDYVLDSVYSTTGSIIYEKSFDEEILETYTIIQVETKDIQVLEIDKKKPTFQLKGPTIKAYKYEDMPVTVLWDKDIGKDSDN